MSSPEGEDAEGQVGHREEIYYHRDTEGTEFRRKSKFSEIRCRPFPFFKIQNPSVSETPCSLRLCGNKFPLRVLVSPSLRSHSAQTWEELSRVLPLLVASLIRMLR
jgi:hypothetical protein